MIDRLAFPKKADSSHHVWFLIWRCPVYKLCKQPNLLIINKREEENQRSFPQNSLFYGRVQTMDNLVARGIPVPKRCCLAACASKKLKLWVTYFCIVWFLLWYGMLLLTGLRMCKWCLDLCKACSLNGFMRIKEVYSLEGYCHGNVFLRCCAGGYGWNVTITSLKK